MRDTITEARKLLAHLGWTYGMPTTRGNSAGWSTTVPLVSDAPLADVADAAAVEKAKAYGIDTNGPDRGRLRVTAPTGSSYFQGMAPLVWADIQVAGLDEHLRIDYDGEVPPLPEAEVCSMLRANAAERRQLLALRITAIQDARGSRPVEHIATAAGVSKAAIYKIYKQTPEQSVRVPGGDVLAVIRDTVAALAEVEDERRALARRAHGEGVSVATIAHFAGVSVRTVYTLIGE
ncbi:hypothetical protein HWC45_gp24 [Corynebacterium phage Stiles]|uniref:Uncharacterized protein n=1 Tax=Corynebacterium phage Stiles TaxID=2588504 RepID=A0A4Y6EMV2_9CAUD|nr:hypothetical protein HWC45_gp24 [Corynebacterium phage Stiles]QDF20036.1 hypothetical protein SEA_STILES_24 [Corynebacterium phage Stiles]